MKIEGHWKKYLVLKPRSYKCGHCGDTVGSKEGYICENGNIPTGIIYICPACNEPTYFREWSDYHVPNEMYGDDVAEIKDENIARMYNEARRCMSVDAFTASVMCSRKILMQIAVRKGAKIGLTFTEYVEFLINNHFAPIDAKEWISDIRKTAGQANHELRIMTRKESEDLIDFNSLLLKIIFEYPERVKKRKEKGKNKN